MSGIFISYRRESTAAFAGRLYDRLIVKFGKERTFIDIDTIEPGEDFVEVLDKKLEDAVALVVLVGHDWLSCTDPQGRVRLENPRDFVRLEVATALRRNVRVIPVLLEDTPMPASQQLPEDLAGLARRQAIRISNERFHQDATKLVEVLEKLLVLSQGGKVPDVTPVKQKRSGNTWFWIAGTVVPIALISIVYTTAQQEQKRPVVRPSTDISPRSDLEGEWTASFDFDADYTQGDKSHFLGKDTILFQIFKEGNGLSGVWAETRITRNLDKEGGLTLHFEGKFVLNRSGNQITGPAVLAQMSIDDQHPTNLPNVRFTGTLSEAGLDCLIVWTRGPDGKQVNWTAHTVKKRV